MEHQGLVHIYCGDGKGKTTAAFGLGLRCAGRGGRVLIAQFLKSRPSGEVAAAKKIPGITVLRGDVPGKFVSRMTPEEKEATRTAHDILLSQAEMILKTEVCHMVILDELIGAWGIGLIDKGAALALIAGRPRGTELVMTGRNPAAELLALADYVSEVRKIRHPFDKGVKARDGIEQ